MPVAPFAVMHLGPNGPEQVQVDCARTGCLQVSEWGVAVQQRDGSVWASWEGRPWGLLSSPTVTDPALLSQGEQWVRSLWLEGDGLALPGIEAKPPTLPKDLRTCGTVRLGDGLGYHIIRNEGDVWQRVHWALQPDPALLAQLPAAAYPLVKSDGSLCGYATQGPSRQWTVHQLFTGLTVMAAPDHEHPPAKCLPPGGLRVRTGDGVLWVDADGTTRQESQGHASAVEGEVNSADVKSKTLIPKPGDVIQLVLPGGRERTLSLSLERDIAGTPLPPNTSRERVWTLGDGRQLLINERLLLPDCARTERLHLLDTENSKIVNVYTGDDIITRLSHGYSGFYWIQARPRLVYLGP